MSGSERPRNKRSAGRRDATEPGKRGPGISSAASIRAPLTSLVGREQDLDYVTRALQSGTRLLTLTGPGGVGKTRLAIQVAISARSLFAGGAYFVPLSHLTDPTLVISTIAHTLGVIPKEGQSALQALRDVLQDRHTLLVLDNFEQVLSAGPQVLDLVQEASFLHVLVTSRAVLRVYGEQEYEVAPLGLPDTSRRTRPTYWSDSDAVRLFAERASAVNPRFRLSAENGADVAEICRRLDGLPLAIELAAARIKLLSPGALLKQMDTTLPLLTRGATSLPYRHRTLRDAILWSYSLLSDSDKRGFRALSVFVGGCTTEAAEALLVDTPHESSQGGRHTLDTLSDLVDQCLLKHEEGDDGEPRFSMLETVREFALEQLENAGETHDTKRKHAEHYLALAEKAQPHLTKPDQLEWANRLEAEHDNVRAALTATLTSGPGTGLDPAVGWIGLRLAAAMWQFWATRGYMSEGRGWLRRALGAAEHLTSGDLETPGVGAEDIARVHLKALNGSGVLARLAGDYPASKRALESGLKIARQLGDLNAVAATLNNLGSFAMGRGDYNEARKLHVECLQIRRDLGLKLESAYSLTQLGNVAMLEGDYGEARRLHEEGLEIKRQAGDKQGVGHSLHSLAIIARREGDLDGARRLVEETLFVARELGNKPGIAYSLRDLGHVMREQGDYPEAERALLESLLLFRELGELTPTAECVIGLARSRLNAGDTPSGVILLAAADSLLAATEALLDPPDREALERDLVEARSTLGEEAFRDARDRGKSLSLDDALTLALGETPPTPVRATADVPPAAPSTDAPPYELTAREREVLQLIAAGLTNPGIAEHLNLSIGTVRTHLNSIFSKLDVHTRTAAVRRAFEHRLI